MTCAVGELQRNNVRSKSIMLLQMCLVLFIRDKLAMFLGVMKLLRRVYDITNQYP